LYNIKDFQIDIFYFAQNYFGIGRGDFVLNSVGHQKDGSSVENRAKAICFVMWLVPFAMSAFSQRRYLAPSSVFISYVAVHFGSYSAAVVIALAIMLFLNSFNNRLIKKIFWAGICLDCLAATFALIHTGTKSVYYARRAIAGEDSFMYRALFWLPLFETFNVTPGLNVLKWTEYILSPVIASGVFSGSLEFLMKFERPPKNRGDYIKALRRTLCENWKILSCAALLVAFIAFARFRENPRPASLDPLKSEDISSLLGIEYRTMPNSESTVTALGLIEMGRHGEATELLRRAVASGDSTAAVTLAEIYERGDMAEGDAATVKSFLLQGARQGNLEALLGLTDWLQYKEKTELLKLAVDAGDRRIDSLLLLGRYYMVGWELTDTSNYLKSARYYQIAAEEGNEEGAWQTAGFYYRGYMADADLDKAEYWANRAKQSADPRSLHDAQANLLLERIREKRDKKQRKR
jgi:hypothetical protein